MIFINNKQYQEYAEKRSEKSPCFKNCIKAFLTGGTICLIAELFLQIYKSAGLKDELAFPLTSISIIFCSALLTGIGIFDKIAKFGGGGALVPITGFSNSVVSPAIEAKSEGYVTGVASKMFTIAGPVIVYGTIASIIYGVVYYLFVM